MFSSQMTAYHQGLLLLTESSSRFEIEHCGYVARLAMSYNTTEVFYGRVLWCLLLINV